MATSSTPSSQAPTPWSGQSPEDRDSGLKPLRPGEETKQSKELQCFIALARWLYSAHRGHRFNSPHTIALAGFTVQTRMAWLVRSSSRGCRDNSLPNRSSLSRHSQSKSVIFRLNFE